MQGYFSMNLEIFSLNKLQKIIQSRDVLPSQVIVKYDLKNRFSILKFEDIQNVSDLLERLKSKKRIEQFSEKTKLPVDYLVILKRYAAGYISKPIKLKGLPGISSDLIIKLDSMNIKNSQQLLERVPDKTSFNKFSEKINFVNELAELVGFCDILRMLYVGPSFARLFYDAGFISVKTYMDYKPEEAYNKLVETNNEKKITKGKFGLHDIELSHELTKDLPIMIDYL